MGMIKTELEWLKIEGFLNKRQLEYLKGQDTLKERRFYLLPKIHQGRATWPFPDVPPGRPIVSDCGSKSYGGTWQVSLIGI